MDLPNFPSNFVAQIVSDLNILQSPYIDNYTKLDLVYNEADKINDFLRPYFSCHSGCSFCCKYDVLITLFEANYIAKKIGLELKKKSFQ